MKLLSEVKAKTWIGIAFFVAALYCIARSVILSFSIDIWYDELFTMEFVTRPIGEMLSIAARDVHPPLYYIIVRIFEAALGAAGLIGDAPGQMAPEVLAKLVSVFPFFILMIYAVTVIRKKFGMLAAGIFSFAIVSMPQLPEYTTEIRMYSYAILFVIGLMIHGYLLYESFLAGNERGWDIGNGFAVWFYASAAAYTHYYGALAAGIIYGMLFVIMLVSYVKTMKSDERKSLSFKAFGMLIICMNLTAIAYIPWISVFLSQASAVKANYWIQPVGIRSLGSAVKHLFKGYFVNETLAVIIAVVLFILVAALFIKNFVGLIKSRESEDLFVIMSFLVLPLLVAGGLIASVLLRPVFVNRYMLPAYGCFWLAIAIMASREIEELIEAVKNKKTALLPGCYQVAGAVLAALILLTGIVDFKSFIGNEEYRQVNMEKTLELFDGISSDTIIISNFNHVQGLLGYYLNRNSEDYRIYLYQQEAEPLIDEMVPGLETIDDPVDIANYLEGGKKVLFLGSFNSREVLLQEWDDEFGIKNDNQGSYLMERYWFDVFKLKNY
ncbi:hypothetical protein D6855_07565 [Butyrivibrio sp. CB08]|uniref:hypothetical protein n=1 Tax=Butyrivibrio sp. CB08 TaxID=2364879 RepID=UPI000EA83C16|nr:hypothetical protein [Butyrivibrio sp. CB08]RKM60557.1 hypothetical protein D6855_07565 [Butyrivibrio sp. CB08]